MIEQVTTVVVRLPWHHWAVQDQEKPHKAGFSGTWEFLRKLWYEIRGVSEYRMKV